MIPVGSVNCVYKFLVLPGDAQVADLHGMSMHDAIACKSNLSRYGLCATLADSKLHAVL